MHIYIYIYIYILHQFKYINFIQRSMRIMYIRQAYVTLYEGMPNALCIAHVNVYLYFYKDLYVSI